MNTLKEYVDNKFTLVPAKPLMAAAIFTTKATTRYPTLPRRYRCRRPYRQ